MKISHIIVTASLGALLALAPVFAAQQTYTVQQGDNLYRIGKNFNTTAEALKALNGMKDDKLSVGQVLKITADRPAAPTAVETPALQSSIQAPAAPAAPAAVKANNQEMPQMPQARQVIKETRTYKVRKGDSLLKIAGSFKVSVDALSSANNLKNNNKLSVGQVLVIPGVTGNAAAAAQTLTAKAEKTDAAPVKIQLAPIPALAPISALTPISAPAPSTAAAQTVSKTAKTAPKPTVNAEDLTVRDRLVEAGFNLLGVRYRYGGTSEKTGLDCSGLVRNIFEKIGLTLPRTSREQYTQGEKVAKEDLQKGDLVFFSSGGKTPTHVGVYIGDNQFLHSASKAKKVVVSDLGKTWYDLRYLGARRIVELWWEDTEMPMTAIPLHQLPSDDAPLKESPAPEASVQKPEASVQKDETRSAVSE